jgi:P4 family phage/plasmid primase-like protien
MLKAAIAVSSNAFAVAEGVKVSQRSSACNLNVQEVQGKTIVKVGPNNCESLHVEQAQSASTNGSTVNLSHLVLDSAFAGGEHLAYTDGAFRRFNRTHWASLSEEELGRIVLKHVGPEGTRRQRTPSLIRDVIATLRHATASTASDEETDASPIINVANGELWVEKNGTVVLRPHNPASNQRHYSDVLYSPSATCPRYDSALADIFSTSPDPAALIALWNEIVGYLLQPIRRQPLIVVAAGRGRDGKSALAETLMRLLGRAQVTSMPVEDLTGSRFVLGDLAESRVFVDLDMTAGVLLPDGPLKKLSEGTTVTAERKFRDPVTFTMRAVPLLLTNNTPRLADRSNGFRRRLLVLPFERQFTEAEVDYGLFPEIHKTELSGVLNRALEGLQRVIRRGWKLDRPEAVNAATEAWWAEAIGGTTVLPPSQRRPAMAKRNHTAPEATLVARMRQQDGREGLPAAGSAGHGVRVSVALPEGSKGCTVCVQAGPGAIEVRFSSESIQEPPMLVDRPTEGR